MKKVEPPNSIPSLRVKQKLKLLMNKLKLPAIQQNPKCTTLYNDFMILNVILNSIPEQSVRELSSELEILEKSIQQECDKQGKRKHKNSQQANKENNLSLEGVMKILRNVQSEDVLLQDFLTCSGIVRSY